MNDVPQGLQICGGVLFDVRGFFCTGRSKIVGVSGLVLPEALLDIPVGRKGKAIHFLQASAFVGGRAGTKIGEYGIHCKNGEVRIANLIYGKNMQVLCQSRFDMDESMLRALVVYQLVSRKTLLQALQPQYRRRLAI